MKIYLILFLGIFPRASDEILVQNETIAELYDAVAGIAPITNHTPRIENSANKGDEKASLLESLQKQSYADNERSVASEISQEMTIDAEVHSASVTQKRNAKGGEITVTSHLEELLLEENDQSTDNTEEHCAFTFIVPKQPMPHQLACGKPPAQEHSLSKEFFTKLHRDVIEAKLQIEDIKSEIIEEKQRFPSQAVVRDLEESVSLLQQEARNMDSRVSQLYMQLLHEIINKRDNTLEMQRMENKLLNQTLEYHRLKEEHNLLKISHVAMETQMRTQAGRLEELKQTVDALSNQPAQSNMIQSVTEANKRRKSSWRSRHNPAPTTPSSSRIPVRRAMRPGPFRDCVEVQRAGYTKSGLFNLRIPGYDKRIRVWCDFEQDPGGWIVIQRRTGRRINFFRNMEAYKRGFGRPHSDFWLGLEHIHKLTTQTGINYKLHIDLEDWNERRTFVEYQSFSVGGEDTDYKLRITHYSGNAGDDLTWHNNMKFTTLDEDNDPFATNCARHHKGGWWYNTCARSNLNGMYYRGGIYTSEDQDGIFWSGWRGKSYSLKSVSMKIMPTE